jgi:hypothetical protein
MSKVAGNRVLRRGNSRCKSQEVRVVHGKSEMNVMLEFIE